MKSATVVGRYPLSIREDGSEGYAKYLGHIGAKHAKAFDFASEGIPEGLSVVEYFGGVGTFSTIIRGKLKPKLHQVFELDPALVKDLNVNGFASHCEDAREVSKYMVADVLVADFPDITIHKATNGGFWEETLDNIFEKEPLYVLYTDVALRYLHLHYERYSKLLPWKVDDKPSYIAACANFVWKKYGYVPVRAAYHNEASVTLFVANTGQPLDMVPWKGTETPFMDLHHIKDGTGGLIIDR